MCNLYSLTKGQAAIREAARAMRDLMWRRSSGSDGPVCADLDPRPSHYGR